MLTGNSEFMGKTFQAAQITREIFDHRSLLQNIFLISAQLNFQKVQKSAKIRISKSIFYVEKSPNFSLKNFIEEYKFRTTFFVKDIF